MPSKVFKAHAAVLAANVFFGINFLTVKYVVPSPLAPITLNILRVSGALFLFWLLYAIKPNKASIQRKHIPRFITCAITGVAINQILFIKGLSLTSTTHASLLILGTPIAIIFIAALVLNEKITVLKMIGLSMGIAGATILILLKENSKQASDVITGDILIILNAISYALYLVLVRPLMQEYSAIHVTRWVFTIGACMMIPYGWSSFNSTEWQAISAIQWGAISIVVICGTFLAYLFNIYGVKNIGPSATGAYIYTQPIFATTLAIFFAGESYSVLKFVAALLIFSGVYLANFYKPPTDS